MRSKAPEFNYGERPMTLVGDTTFDWIETDEFLYLGEW